MFRLCAYEEGGKTILCAGVCSRRGPLQLGPHGWRDDVTCPLCLEVLNGRSS